MPFNGAGVFQRVYSWVTDAAVGIFVRADRLDTDSDDIATGLSNCITRDGQSPATNDIPMGSHKITGLANGLADNHAVNYGQVFTAPTFTGTVTINGGLALNGAGTLTGSIDASGCTFFKVPTVSAGDNSTNAASTAFVNDMAFAAALPAISSATDGLNVTNNGTVASWDVPKCAATRVFQFRNL